MNLGESLLKNNCLIIFLLSFIISCTAAKNEQDYQKAYAYYKDKNFKEALPLFEKVISTSPDNLDYRLRYGNALEDSGDIKSALKQYEALISKKPDHILGLVSLANAQRRDGKIKEAVETMTKAISLKKKEPWMLDNYANILEQAGQFDQAYSNYKLAVQYEPNDPEFRMDLANLCKKMGRNDEAISLFTDLKKETQEQYQILKQQEDLAETKEEKLRFFQEKEPYQKSLDYINKAIQELQG